MVHGSWINLPLSHRESSFQIGGIDIGSQVVWNRKKFDSTGKTMIFKKAILSILYLLEDNRV